MKIVYLMAVQWDFLWQRPQALLQALSERQEVIAVEAPLPLSEGLRQPRRVLRNLAKWLRGGQRLNPNLLVVSPIPLRLPLGRRFAAAAWLNDMLLYLSLRWLRWRLRLGTVDLFVSTLPDMVQALGALDARTTVYDCADQYTGFGSGADEVMRRREEALCLRVDVVVAVSERLGIHKASFNRNTRVIRNGVDPRFVEAGRALSAGSANGADGKSVAGTAAAGPGARRIGFVGAIYPWVDVPLIRRLAEAFPQDEVVLVGPVKTDVSALRDCSNVRLLGALPHAQLPGTIAAFDVCILPFQLNDLTRSSNPVKLYEYLALGKPVVATAIDEAAAFGDLIRVAGSTEEFIQQVGAALTEGEDHASYALRQRRIAFAEDNSWPARARDFEALVGVVEQGTGQY